MRGRVGRGFAEHHVIGASLAGEHGIMTAAQAPGAGDTVGLEHAERGGERRDPGEMGAVGAGAGDDFGMAVEEKRNIAALNDGSDGFDAVDQRAFVASFEAKENGRDIAGFQRRADVARKRRCVAKERREEVKPWTRALRVHRISLWRLTRIRHPEVRAQRASKGDGPGASAVSFEGRFAAASG
jgi:hypothetical protein